jgi:hypothetical protein
MSVTVAPVAPVVTRIADLLSNVATRTGPFSTIREDSTPAYATWNSIESDDLHIFVVMERSTPRNGPATIRVRVDISAKPQLRVPEQLRLVLETDGEQSHHRPFRLDVDEAENIADLTVPLDDVQENTVLSVAVPEAEAV